MKSAGKLVSLVEAKKSRKWQRACSPMLGICFSSADRSNGAWPPLSFYRLRKGFCVSSLFVVVNNARNISRVVSMNPIIIEQMKKREKKNKKSLGFRGIEYLGDRELSLESRSHVSSEEGRRRSKQKRVNLATYASGRTRARNGGRAL